MIPENIKPFQPTNFSVRVSAQQRSILLSHWQSEWKWFIWWWTRVIMSPWDLHQSVFMLYGFSSVAARYLCCHLHRWTWLRGTYPMISSVSGPINTISNVLSSHMTVCLKTSLSPSLRPRRQCVGANDLCCLCGMELREWLSGGGFWNRDGCIMRCFLGGTYAIWRRGLLLLLNCHFKKYRFVGLKKSLHITITQMQVPRIATIFSV